MSDTLRVSNLHFGNAASNYNQPQMGFTSVGIGSTANYGFLQFFGTSNTLCWTANGTVGIGTTAPRNALDVNGSLSIGNRVLGTPDSSPNGTFWLGLNGTGTEAERLAIGIAGNQTSGIVNTIELNKNTNVLGNFIKKGTTDGYDIRISGGTATNSGYVDFFANGVSRGYIGNASLIDLDIVAQNGTKLNFYTAGTRRLLIDTNGNVGIGTASINYTLQIGTTESILRIGGLTNAGSSANTSTYGLERSRNQIQFSGYRDALTDKVGAKIVGINKQTYANTTVRHVIQSTDLAFFTVPPDTNDLDNTVERMRITDTGNVGIGTAAPASALHVVGSNSVGTPAVVSFVNSGGGQNGTGSDIVNSQITMGAFGPYIRSVQQNTAYTDGIRLDLCTNLGSNDSTPIPRISILAGLYGGFVGIGITNPTVPFYVNNFQNINVVGGNWTAQNYNTALAGPFSSTQNISAYFAGYASSSIGFLTYSDERIKKDIEPATNCLDTVLQLRPVTYRKKNVIEDGNELHTGFIAQDVEKVYPSAIYKRTDTIPSIYAIRHAVLVEHGIQLTESIDVPLEARVVVIDFHNKKIQMIHRPDNILFFENQTDTIELDGDKVFIFGHEVSDKLMLNHDSLFAVGMGAIKELAQKHEALTATYAALKARMDALETRLNA